MSESEKQVKLFALKVLKKEGELARKELIKKNLLLTDYYLAKDDQYLYFPVKKDDIAEFNSNWEFISRNFVEKEKIIHVQDKLKEMLPEDLHSFLPSSFDMLGKAILIKLPEELFGYTSKIGEIILKHFKLQSVFNKIGDVSTIYRTSRYECIAGEDEPIITIKLNNLRFILNINKVYFNLRLGIEYKRMIEHIRDGDIIIDMFSGIGPFSILCAATNQVTTYSCDVNPHAIKYLFENLELNKNVIKGKLNVYQGDISEKINMFPKADVIFMNLPESAIDFLEIALLHLKEKGIIFLHQFIRFVDNEDAKELKYFQKYLERKVKELNIMHNLTKNSINVSYRILRKVSPSKSHVVWEIKSG